MSVLYGTDQFPPPPPSPLIWPKSPPSPINTLINIVINADKNASHSLHKKIYIYFITYKTSLCSQALICLVLKIGGVTKSCNIKICVGLIGV